MLGYLYQVRYGLSLLLDREEATLYLERLDDIELKTGGQPSELLQLKHRAPDGAVTDMSPDLWKTLNIWATVVASASRPPEGLVFVLVSTREAAADSSIRMLRPGPGRQADAAERGLVKAAQDSKNESTAAARASFLSMDAGARKRLIEAVYLADSSPDITDLAEVNRKRIGIAVASERRQALVDRVEGWWFDVCVQMLTGKRVATAGAELWAKVADVASQLRPAALPIDYQNARPADGERARLSKRQFVDQLSAIRLDDRLVEYAILDYYRAFAQRSRWVRDKLLLERGVEDYEQRLKEEWDRYRIAAMAKAKPSDSDDDALVAVGHDILCWVERVADVRIRDDVREPYVQRGSFHMLADKNPPDVWWHPLYVERLKAVLGSVDA